jgi:hypothetical protein
MSGRAGGRSRRPPPAGKAGSKRVQQRELPKSETFTFVDRTLNFSSLRRLERGEVKIKPSKPFQEIPQKEHASLFIAKCQDCCLLCDFSTPNADGQAKTTKTQLLKHLASAFTIPSLVRTIPVDSVRKFYDMLSINLFRPIPQLPLVSAIETHDSACDSAWAHLNLAYDCLLASVNCPQAISGLTAEFFYQLIGNGASPDERERIIVRDILHALYTKCMAQRTLIREKIAAQFTIGVCSSELLTFFVSVASGFNSPLAPEHVTFFHRHVLPLHSLSGYAQFSAKLVQLVVTYISKSGFLLDPTVSYLLNHWPKSHRLKQSLFLKQLETLFGKFEIHITQQIAMAVFALIGRTTLTENSDVAEAAIDILMNPALAFTIKTHAGSIFPVVIPPAYRAARKHWDEVIRANAFVALQTIAELDQSTFSRVKDGLKTAKTTELARSGIRSGNWAKLFDAAKTADRTVKAVVASRTKADCADVPACFLGDAIG